MWFRFRSFIKFYIKSITKYNIHSPFIFDFVCNVLDISKEYYSFDVIEKERNRLKSDNRKINVNDYGAGSSFTKSPERKIAAIAGASLSGISKCRVLFNLADHYRCLKILELGTSLGISSAYFASANHKGSVITLEGDEEIAQIAGEVHKNLGIKNIDIVIGKFEISLADVLTNINRVDLAFIDGHHSKVPTIHYFNKIIEKCHNESIIVIDDIYWSEEMNSAWNIIISHTKVSLSIDLFDYGIVFLKKELSKENISYLPFWYKPWRIGLFR